MEAFLSASLCYNLFQCMINHLARLTVMKQRPPVIWLDTDDKHLVCQLFLSQSKAYCTVESPKNTQKKFELSRSSDVISKLASVALLSISFIGLERVHILTDWHTALAFRNRNLCYFNNVIQQFLC